MNGRLASTGNMSTMFDHVGREISIVLVHETQKAAELPQRRIISHNISVKDALNISTLSESLPKH